jgi:hypothetical protein
VPFATTAVNQIQIIHNGFSKKEKEKEKAISYIAINPEIPYLQK